MGTRGCFAAVGLVVACVAGCQQQDDVSWREFSSAEGRFTAKFPGTPTEETHSVSTPIGDIAFHVFGKETRQGAFAVAYSDFPLSLVQNADVSRMLDGGRDGAVANVKGRLEKESKIKQNGAPGRELLIYIKDTVYCRCQVFLARNRLYQVHVLGTKEQVQSQEATKFFNLFDFYSEGRVASR
jgi:hypothetical protein